MNLMLPTLKMECPNDTNWLYEIKYDGFRAILKCDQNELQLISRNGKDLLPLFPEIRQFLHLKKAELEPFYPFTLDGELVILFSQGKANFSQIQTRGRMRSQVRIEEASEEKPATLLVFDVLQLKGKDLKNLTYRERKKKLFSLFETCQFPLSPELTEENRVQLVPTFQSKDEVMQMVDFYDGEGIVTKHALSNWENKRTEKWIKTKNWKNVNCFITAFDEQNGYYHIAVFKEKEIYPIGAFYFGITPQEKQVLNEIIKKNSNRKEKSMYYIHPSICVQILYLEWYEDGLREPHFHYFLFDHSAEDCTWEQMQLDALSLPEVVEITHPEKPLWSSLSINKLDYISYLRRIAPFMMPFLQSRALTVIRYPHGFGAEAFFQKNCPDYAPSFINRTTTGDIDYIVCDSLKTFLWLGNQLAIEFHIPFQTIHSPFVSEIVFDLDPPSRNQLELAKRAALDIKELLDALGLTSFVKFSGNKGLQVYIPLPDEQFLWKDTQTFTETIAHFLKAKRPELYTLERLKKNRKNRLYIDYIQHREGKTIIAPYSLRGNEDGLVAAPLFWEEVETFDAQVLTMNHVIERLTLYGCPFSSYFKIKKNQPFAQVLHMFKNKD
ncbi:bifunctional non-homologous end joining protein LigD [Oikeobacillus pervagus]|uniref:DNA ligase (ATP) n=1 Tax=Oikeobacillus pervagus TaxID=1325931 RepID=A0AAJ1WII7_9BACI|nr:DNA ligase D [Oikeobacillus pervagus]MDQ0214393.1 bifunctional non-homologous end joining protein LigD [Oikeobacillus pervagus]